MLSVWAGISRPAVWGLPRSTQRTVSGRGGGFRPCVQELAGHLHAPPPLWAHHGGATCRWWSRQQGRLNHCMERTALRSHPSCVRLNVGRKGLPMWLSSKESTCQSRTHGFNPGLGRSPGGGGHGNPLQYSCLENPRLPQRSLAGYSPRGHKRVRRNLATKQQPTTSGKLCVLSSEIAEFVIGTNSSLHI